MTTEESRSLSAGPETVSQNRLICALGRGCTAEFGRKRIVGAECIAPAHAIVLTIPGLPEPVSRWLAATLASCACAQPRPVITLTF